MLEITLPKLSVNINKIATLRNARGGNNPDVVQMALLCEKFGAQGITVHPRPDERHIRYADVVQLSETVTTEFNIEGYPSEDFLQLIETVKPHQVTLVPDPPDAITSNAGWDTITHETELSLIIQRIKKTVNLSLRQNAQAPIESNSTPKPTPKPMRPILTTQNPPSSPTEKQL
jgi:pyridoxine 5-phosphate synthase